MAAPPLGSPADEDACMRHAIDVHGLHQRPCPVCDGDDPVCATCEGLGVVFHLRHAGRCGHDCPLRSDA